MPACALGCDGLYERGYLAVDDDGRIVVSPSVADLDSPVGRRLDALRGRTCTAFTDRS